MRVPRETDELRRRFAAKVESIVELDSTSEPNLPGARSPSRETTPTYRRALLRVSFPLENVGLNLPTVLATVAGNLFELAEFSGLRLLNLDFPDEFKLLPQPQFGVAGIGQWLSRRAIQLEGTKEVLDDG